MSEANGPPPRLPGSGVREGDGRSLRRQVDGCPGAVGRVGCQLAQREAFEQLAGSVAAAVEGGGGLEKRQVLGVLVAAGAFGRVVDLGRLVIGAEQQVGEREGVEGAVRAQVVAQAWVRHVGDVGQDKVGRQPQGRQAFDGAWWGVVREHEGVNDLPGVVPAVAAGCRGGRKGPLREVVVLEGAVEGMDVGSAEAVRLAEIDRAERQPDGLQACGLVLGGQRVRVPGEKDRRRWCQDNPHILGGLPLQVGGVGDGLSGHSLVDGVQGVAGEAFAVRRADGVEGVAQGAAEIRRWWQLDGNSPSVLRQVLQDGGREEGGLVLVKGAVDAVVGAGLFTWKVRAPTIWVERMGCIEGSFVRPWLCWRFRRSR